MKRATLLLVFASALYIPYLGNLITYDEVVTVRYFAVSPVYALTLWAAPNNHLLHSLLVWASTMLIGRSEIAIRLPAFFAALLTIAGTYRLGRRMQSKQSGLLAAVIVTCLSGLIAFATTARGYSLGLFLTIQLMEHVLFPRRTARRLLLLSMALILVVPSMIMLLLGVGLWAILRSHRLAPALVVGTLSGGMFYLPSIILRTFVVDFGLLSWVELAHHFAELLKPAPLWGLLAPLATIGFFGLQPRHRWLWASIALVTVAVTVIQGAVSQRFFYARNYLYLFPLLAILAGTTAACLPRWSQGIITLSWILPPLMWTMTQVPVSADILSAEPDLMRLVDYIDTDLSPGDGLMVGCCIDQPLWYYAARRIDQLDPDGKRRLVAVTTPHATLEQVLDGHGIKATCVLMERWQAVVLYECVPAQDER